MAHDYDLAEFLEKFAKVKEMGFVRAQRSGPTGVGHTLEQLLGMKENNIALPDLGEVELKGRRINAGSMVTLFTFNRKAWQVKPLYAVRTYGSLDKNGRQGLYYTLSQTPNGAGLFLFIEAEEISVRHVSGEILVNWKLEDLEARFMQKIPAFVLVSAFSELRDGVEWFSYSSAQIVHGTSPSILSRQFQCGTVAINVKIPEESTQSDNYDAEFCVKENEIAEFFASNTAVETIQDYIAAIEFRAKISAHCAKPVPAAMVRSGRPASSK